MFGAINDPGMGRKTKKGSAAIDAMKKAKRSRQDVLGMYMASGLLQGMQQINQNKAQEAIETMQAGFERLSIQSQRNAVDQQANMVRTNSMRKSMQVSQQGAQGRANVDVSQAMTGSSVGDLMATANMQEAMALQDVATAEQQQQLELNIKQQQLDNQMQQLDFTQQWNRQSRKRENRAGLLSGVLGGAMQGYTAGLTKGLF